MIKFDSKGAEKFIRPELLETTAGEAGKALESLLGGSGAGYGMQGWIALPLEVDGVLIENYKRIASNWNGTVDCVVVLGIGGSYLGAKCAIEALSDTFAASGVRTSPQIIFAGNSLSQDYFADLMDFLKDKTYSIIVISKSGTTTETAIAFRLLRSEMIRRFGVKIARERIVTVTDARNGALRKLSDEEKYSSFCIPSNVGGRFSVLTPVGLLPIAVAGFDVEKIAKGAKKAMSDFSQPGINNLAVRYAAIRNALYRSGKKIEIFANYNPRLHFFGEWLKQLFGESEGKGGKGIFPASVDLTTDLHSMGQYIQDGERILFETEILIRKSEKNVTVPVESDDEDGINYLAGKTLEEINKKAEEGTRMAHIKGGVPVITVEAETLDEYAIGELFYFFEMACAIDGYVLGVNPFDQPGVEEYKRNMFTLLGKPGYGK